MNKLKVIGIKDAIEFEHGYVLFSDHFQDCCENHELTFDDLQLSDFDGLEFDLSGDDFFKRNPDYGIELVPLKGHSVKIPGHGSNNGYYGSNIDLVIEKYNVEIKRYDISECQDCEYM